MPVEVAGQLFVGVVGHLSIGVVQSLKKSRAICL